ncbi:MAG: hypothetical protein AAF658_11370 [Myxococcota bacterium]
MDFLIPAGLLALVVFVFVVWPILQRREDTALGEEWARAAQSLGMAAVEDRNALAQELSSSFPRAVVGGAVQGQIESVGVLFVLVRYVVRNARSQGSQNKTSTAVRLDLAIPEMTIGRNDESISKESEGKAMLRELMGAVMPESMSPVIFRDDPEFQERFTVSGPHHDAILAFLTPEVRKHYPTDYDVTLTSNGRQVLWTFSHRKFGADELPGLKEKTVGLIRALRARVNDEPGT